MKYIGLIPSRYGSSRFLGKPLCDIDGKPMIWHVYKSAKKWDKFDEVYIATDDKRISDRCEELNIPYIITNTEHKDCVDRCAEASRTLKDQNIEADRYIIIQGDEPIFNVKTLDTDLSPSIVNFYTNVKLKEEEYDPNCVKVIFNKNNKAIYFSRHTLPYDDSKTRKINDKLIIYKQIGVYSFDYESLQNYDDIGVTYLEGLEGIGLNRLIEEDIDITMRYTKYDSISVDTEEDRLKIIDIINKC